MARAAPTNARTVSDASTGGGARLPMAVAARSATWRRVNSSGHPRTPENRRPLLTASDQRQSVAQPATAVVPTILKGLVCRRISAGLCRFRPKRAKACAMADAEYQRRASIASGTTSTTASHLRHRYRRHGTSIATGTSNAAGGPSICRTRRPWPCSRSPCPDGRLATPQHGQCAGRTSSTAGILDNHRLTSRALCTIRLLLRSFSLTGIYPGPDGDGVSAPVPITFSEPRPLRESGPLLQGARTTSRRLADPKPRLRWPPHHRLCALPSRCRIAQPRSCRNQLTSLHLSGSGNRSGNRQGMLDCVSRLGQTWSRSVVHGGWSNNSNPDRSASALSNRPLQTDGRLRRPPLNGRALIDAKRSCKRFMPPLR